MVKDALQTSVALMRLQNVKEKQRSYLYLAIMGTLTPPPSHNLLRIYGVFKVAGLLCSFTTINTSRVSAEVFPLGSDVWLMKAIAATVYTTASQPVKADERCRGASSGGSWPTQPG